MIIIMLMISAVNSFNTDVRCRLNRTRRLKLAQPGTTKNSIFLLKMSSDEKRNFVAERNWFHRAILADWNIFNGDTNIIGINRRSALVGFSAMVSLGAPKPAFAAKGAAEYDLEYYLRDIVKGNKKEGSQSASIPPPTMPPRTLTSTPTSGLFLSFLLDKDCSDRCVPGNILRNYSSNTLPVSDLVESYRSRSIKTGYVQKWEIDDVMDEYYFDITSYALWRAAAEIIPDYLSRDKFVRDIGRMVYSESTKAGILSQTAEKMKDEKSVKLTRTISALIEILDLFQTTKFCSSYRVGSSDPQQQKQDSKRKKDANKNSAAVIVPYIFDELDDDFVLEGSSINLLISIFRPATLGAALQITGEGSRFSPEYVATTIAAMFEAFGFVANYETYFVDNKYRENPKDFFPDEQLLQFTISLKKAKV